MKKILLLLLLLFLLISCSNNDRGNGKKQLKEIEKKVLLTAEQLEKAGFMRLDGKYFSLYLLEDDGFILFHMKENIMIRYKSPDDIRQYQAHGQGPGQFLRLSYIFKYDEQTIGIHDTLKKSVLLFDMDLNYKNEIKIDPRIETISPLSHGNGFIAFGFFGGKVFAFLDRDFNIKETFFTEVKKGRLSNLYRRNLNYGKFLNNDRFIFTRDYYVDKICRVDIYSANARKLMQKLEWEQDHLPTEKDNIELKNRYTFCRFFEYDGFYLMVNGFLKDMSTQPVYDLIIFEKSGKIIYRDKKFPQNPVKLNNAPKSRLFFITDDEALAYIEVKDLINR